MSENFTDQFKGYGDLGLIGVKLPQFQIDKKEYEKLGLKDEVPNPDFLWKLCNERMKTRKVIHSRLSEYEERLKTEFDVLKELGYIDYILLIWDICNFADLNNIPRGVGRGSAAGSLVLYLIGVTGVDPIKYELFFERFVSKARSKKIEHEGEIYFDGGLLPDVDLDFCYYRRQEVLDYIEGKFPSRTCKILTCSTLQGKIVLKEAAKLAGDYGEGEVKVLAGYVGKVFGKVLDLASAFEESAELQGWMDEPQKKWKFCDNRTIAKIAMKLEGLPNNYGVHPAAMAITNGPLADVFPTQLSKDGHVVTAFDMYTVQDYAVKVDVLGLKTVSVLDEISKLTGFKVEDIDLDDPKLFEPFETLKTPHGIFQIEAPTQFRAAQKVKPESLAEVSDLMALARPGALSYIDDYADFKTGVRGFTPVNEELDKILASTKGVALYQEQMMAIGHKVFGLTLEEAEILRRIVGKKKVEEMPKWKEKIYEAAERLGLSKEIADLYWKILDDSKAYSFNKCLAPETIIETPEGFKTLNSLSVGDKVLSYDLNSETDVFSEVLDVIEGEAEVYEVEMEDGIKIICSLDHKFLCEDGEMRPLRRILEKGLGIVCK